jgi:type VI secretion system protein ImpL
MSGLSKSELLIWISVAVLVVALWVTFAVLHIPLWVPAVLTVVPLLVFGAVFMVRYLKAIQGSSKLEHAMSNHASGVAASMRPDLGAELKELSDEFNKAVASLKSSHLKGGGRGALYALPWYALVGPPGSGKTTALRNSGLHFPYMSTQRGGALKGVGGTRNCDWWLTNDGILLDTAGRWSTQDDEEEWVSFLKLLKQHRRHQPLNGLLVAVGIGEIVDADDEGRARLAKRLRERIDELVVRLEISAPVYVLLTKCDLLPGFVETFGEMTKSERGQIWGFTAPVTQRMEQGVGAYFAERFTTLLAALEEFALARMGQTRRGHERTRVFSFTRQFAATRDSVQEFLELLFQPNVYSASPMFRGVYFSSATQEGRPIERLLRGLSQDFGIEAEVPVADVAVPKSYFLSDLFASVIFADKSIAAPTEANARRRRLVRFSVAAVMFATALAIAVLPISAWAASQRFLYSTRTLIEQVTAAKGARLTGLALVEKLDAVRAAIVRLQKYDKEGPPPTMGFGMYRGGDLYGPLQKRYVKLVREKIVRPVVEASEIDLRRLADRYANQPDVVPPLKEYFGTYSTLKTYLYLTEPKEANEPTFGAERGPKERPWLSRQIAERWARVQSGGESMGESWIRPLQAQVDVYLTFLEQQPDLSSPRSQDAVAGTRRALGRVSSAKLALEQIIIEYENRGTGLDLRKLVGSTGTWLVSDERVRGAFTRDAWEDSVRNRLYSGEVGLGEGWVVAGPARGEAFIARARDNLRTVYFQAYVEEWEKFLQSIELQPVGNEEQSLALLQELTRGNPPLMGRLLIQVHRNTHLPEPEPDPAADSSAGGGGIVDAAKRKLAEAAKSALPGGGGASGQTGGEATAGAAGAGATAPPDPPKAEIKHAAAVAQVFEGLTQFAVPTGLVGEGGAGAAHAASTDLAVYQEQLAFLRDALQAYRENPSSGAGLTERLQQARVRVLALLDTQPAGWRPRLESLLWPPIEAASVTMGHSVATGTGNEWCAQVYAPYERTIRGRYPFSYRGEDVSVQDFTAFYNPSGGTLWSFYDSVLAQYVKGDGKGYQFTTKVGQSGDAMYQRGLLTFLKDSRAVSNAFFPPGGSSAQVEFDVLVHPVPGVAGITLKAHGQTIRYRNGPESWTRIKWPGSNPAEGASLEAVGGAGRSARFKEIGEWGIFRLLERGRATPAGKGSQITVSWPLEQEGAAITLEVRSTRADSPLGLQSAQGGSILDRLRSRQLKAPKTITTGSARCGG